MINKDSVRKKIGAIRNNIPLEEKVLLDSKLCESLINTIVEKKAQVVHTYIPIKSEVNIYPVIEFMLSNSITVIAPKAMPDMKMINLNLNSTDSLENGIFGTKHPSGNNEYHGKYDIIIVPGLAFDKKNNRIGYGAGYYDVFLRENINAFKVAVSYPFQILDKIPIEEHDVVLDQVLF